jgi:E3 ubiquitin-protein ligase DOA10
VPDLTVWQEFGVIGLVVGFLLYAVGTTLYFTFRQMAKAREFHEQVTKTASEREAAAREENAANLKAHAQRVEAMTQRHNDEREKQDARHKEERDEINGRTIQAIDKNTEAINKIGEGLLEALRTMGAKGKRS